MLRVMARDFLAAECPKVKTKIIERDEKGFDPRVWRRMAELGWMGLVLPEQYGGSGAGFMDVVVLMEEMGRNILPGPFFSTVALAALPIMDFASDGQKSRYLPGIASGDKVWSFAIEESGEDTGYSRIKTSALKVDSGYVLKGEKAFVPYGNSADYMLVTATVSQGSTRDKGPTLFVVDARKPGVEIEIIPTITGEVQCQVRFKGVNLTEDDVLGVQGEAGPLVEQILCKAALLKCAEVSGACQAVLDMTNTYAKERIQFGKPIGAFQVIQHRLVDMLIDAEGLQYLVYRAAWLMDSGLPCADEVAVAKVKANEVYQRVALDGVKIHGAIGFSMDHDIGMYYRRVLAAKFFPHDTDHYLEKVAAGIGL